MRKAIREGEIKLGNIILRVAVLDDGTRVIEGDGIQRLLSAPTGSYTQEEATEAFRKMQSL